MNASSLTLTAMPYVFTQDELLDSGDFAKRAGDCAFADIDNAMLRELHERRHLLPLYRISDHGVVGRRLPVAATRWGHNPRGWVLQAAQEGRLHDPYVEGYSVDWPYERPDDAPLGQWWNGFVYSSWQLLELAELRPYLETAERRWWRDGRLRTKVSVDSPWSPQWSTRGRNRTIALAGLANRYLPEIVGRARLTPGDDWEAFETSRRECGPVQILTALGIAPATLADLAERLLMAAHGGDPLADWWPLVRRASATAWDKLKGPSLLAINQRIAAEILLRSHEELADTGNLEALPDQSSSMFWHPLLDRIGPSARASESLERVLVDFGLSPHPRVLLLVEGQTEELHVSRLLDVLIGGDETLVKVQTLGGVDTNPHLLVRHVVAPRIGDPLLDGWELAYPVTALAIVVDPEGRWSTPEKRARAITKLRNAIRSDVERQGATIDDATLDVLIRVRVWSEPCYEFENFTNDEIAGALEAIALRNGIPDAGAPAWLSQVRVDLAGRRRQGVPLSEQTLRRAHASKIELADELWPVLEAKLHAELDGDVTTPILAEVLEAIDAARRIPRGRTVLPGVPPRSVPEP